MSTEVRPSNQELLRALEAVDRWKEKPEMALNGYRRSMVVMAEEIDRLVQQLGNDKAYTKVLADLDEARRERNDQYARNVDQQAEIERLRAVMMDVITLSTDQVARTLCFDALHGEAAPPTETFGGTD